MPPANPIRPGIPRLSCCLYVRREGGVSRWLLASMQLGPATNLVPIATTYTDQQAGSTLNKSGVEGMYWAHKVVPRRKPKHTLIPSIPTLPDSSEVPQHRTANTVETLKVTEIKGEKNFENGDRTKGQQAENSSFTGNSSLETKNQHIDLGAELENKRWQSIKMQTINLYRYIYNNLSSQQKSAYSIKPDRYMQHHRACTSCIVKQTIYIPAFSSYLIQNQACPFQDGSRLKFQPKTQKSHVRKK